MTLIFFFSAISSGSIGSCSSSPLNPPPSQAPSVVVASELPSLLKLNFDAKPNAVRLADVGVFFEARDAKAARLLEEGADFGSGGGPGGSCGG